MTARPSVTAIIATRNRAAVLPQALDSIYAQEGLGTEFDIEVIVVDDASTDDETSRVVARYPQARCIRLSTNRGQAAARNAAISSSAGKYVAFLDDDDLWFPRKLASQVAALEAHPEAGVAYSPFIIASGTQRSVFPEGPAPSGLLFERMLFVNLCGIPAAPLVRREPLEKVGGFSEDLLSVEDYDLWLRLSFQVPFVFVPGAVAVYRRAPEGNMLTFMRSGAYEEILHAILERALAMLPDTDDASTLKQRARANCQLRVAALLTTQVAPDQSAAAWERLRRGVMMWPGLALNPRNRLSIAQIIAGRAVSSDSPDAVAAGLWKEINDLQRGLGRQERAEMRRLLAAVYWQVGVMQGKGIGRPVHAVAAARAIVRSIPLDPMAFRNWGALLGFVARSITRWALRGPAADAERKNPK